MPRIEYPPEIKAKAKQMYLEGNSISDIAAEVSRLADRNPNRGAIYRWIEDGHWDESRTVVATRVATAVENRAERTVLERVEEHAGIYRKLSQKGVEAIENFIAPASMTEATQAIDVGLKGERQAMSGLVSMKFIQKIILILNEEVTDDEVKRKIARRLQDAASEILSV